ncbi:MAG: CopG family ribbon-helix-helix protein [Egibacteraceae bacterium]
MISISTATVTISLPPELARQVDDRAQAEGRTRSELFREAVRQYLERRDRWEEIFQYWEQASAQLGLEEADAVRIVREHRRER